MAGPMSEGTEAAMGEFDARCWISRTHESPPRGPWVVYLKGTDAVLMEVDHGSREVCEETRSRLRRTVESIVGTAAVHAAHAVDEVDEIEDERERVEPDFASPGEAAAYWSRMRARMSADIRTVSGCGDCPARCGAWCTISDPVGRRVPASTPPPEWCPLRRGPVTLRLSEEGR